MDYHDPSQRRYAQNPYATTQEAHLPPPPQQQEGQRQSLQSHAQEESQQRRQDDLGHFAAPASFERFRQPSILQNPIALSSTGRAGHDPHVYDYGQGTQYDAGLAEAPSMRYPVHLQTPDAPRPSASSQYPQYGSNVMYVVDRPTQATQQQSQLPYDPAGQFRYREGAPTETMALPLAVPPQGQYFPHAHVDPSSTPTSEFKYPQASPQYPLPSAYTPAGPSTAHAHVGSMLHPSSGLFSGYPQDTREGQQQATTPQMTASSHYQTQMQVIFTNVHDGALTNVGGLLLEASSYLLGQVEQLGLTTDSPGTHDDFVRLWDQFNHAWLTTLQAQLDLTQAMLRTGQEQAIMSAQELDHLGTELVRLCDGIERHGLVDYQMGVAEEEIMDLLLKCIALLEPHRSDSPGGNLPHAESSATAAARGR